MSGCGDCFKLFGPPRTLCHAHRVRRSGAAVLQTAMMAEWVMAVFGAAVCRLCKAAPGVDHWKFGGKMGGGARRAWSCHVCHGFVVVDAPLGATELPGREQFLRELTAF